MCKTDLWGTKEVWWGQWGTVGLLLPLWTYSSLCRHSGPVEQSAESTEREKTTKITMITGTTHHVLPMNIAPALQQTQIM